MTFLLVTYITECKLQDNTECLFIEIKEKRNVYSDAHIIPIKIKYLNICTCLSKGLDTYISQYDNIMPLGDLNVESLDPVLNNFCNVSLVKEPTCFKNPNLSCVDVFLCLRSFKNTLTIETGILDFHNKKQKPKIIQYRSYKNFDKQVFQRELNQ